MKCHDLKHILDRIEDKLTGEEAVIVAMDRIITLRVVRRLWTSRFFGVKSKANTTMDSR